MAAKLGQLIFGFDIGTTSIGFAAIDYDEAGENGRILRIGTRIFPEARDEKHTPFNQDRRSARTVRKGRRRKRDTKKRLNELLSAHGMLPIFGTKEWDHFVCQQQPENAPLTKQAKAQQTETPFMIRAIGQSERLTPMQIGRALYHMVGKKHFQAKVFDEDVDGNPTDDQETEIGNEEKDAQNRRKSTIEVLKKTGLSFSEFLVSEHNKTGKFRNFHVHRAHIEKEFDAIILQQRKWHPQLLTDELVENVRDLIFMQNPVFWRINTLGKCPYFPGESPAPKFSWLACQKRMLENLNNLEILGADQMLTDADRQIIKNELQLQNKLTWTSVKNLLSQRLEEQGLRRDKVKFNLERTAKSKDKSKLESLIGNPVEAKIAENFGPTWMVWPHREAFREWLPAQIWSCSYRHEHKSDRVYIRGMVGLEGRTAKRDELRKAIEQRFQLGTAQAKALSEIEFPTGWDRYSERALKLFVPHLEVGVRFGDLVASRDEQWVEWRRQAFSKLYPDTEDYQQQPFSRLPSPLSRGWDKTENGYELRISDQDMKKTRFGSPAQRKEQERLKGVRNPTVVRIQNELRKVFNNLVDEYGKPEKIRIELVREIGMGKKQREEMEAINEENERERNSAKKWFKENNIEQPTETQIRKYLLAKEVANTDIYSNQSICAADIIGDGNFELEHIWPKSKSHDNGLRNLTLCHRDWNRRKNDRSPHQAFGDGEDWDGMKQRLANHVKAGRMSPSKLKRFVHTGEFDEDFVARQLVDTSYAAKELRLQLSKLFPTESNNPSSHVQTVAGKITNHLRNQWKAGEALWGSGKKNRGDHRHHALDATIVALTCPKHTHRLSNFWKLEDARLGPPEILPPWPSFKTDLAAALKIATISYRVDKKTSGPLHAQKPLGAWKDKRYPNNDDPNLPRNKGQVVIKKRVPVHTLGERVIASNDFSSGGAFIVDKGTREAVQSTLERALAVEPSFKKAIKSLETNPPELMSHDRHARNQGQRVQRVTVLSRAEDRTLHLPRKDMPPEEKPRKSQGVLKKDLLHHIAIFKVGDKYRCDVVSLLEVAQRKSKRLPIVDRQPEDGGDFLFSLSKNDMIELDRNKKDNKTGTTTIETWVVTGLESDGRAAISPAFDARPGSKNVALKAGYDSEREVTRDRLNTMMSYLVRKVSVDPIGRVRPAND
jgi:CRISPR-associated endonuclease Csn1